MATILTPLQAAHSEALSLGKDQELRQYGMSTVELLQDSARFSLKLSESTTELHVIYNPSSFVVTGAPALIEKKSLSLSLAASGELTGALLCFETRVKELLRGKHPKIDLLWNSCVKEPTEKTPLMVRCKVSPESARLFDADKKAITLTEQPLSDWRGLPANAVLQVRGIYVRKDSMGLQLNATHLQFGSERVSLPSGGMPVIENPF
jgi:hypothetical protein